MADHVTLRSGTAEFKNKTTRRQVIPVVDKAESMCSKPFGTCKAKKAADDSSDDCEGSDGRPFIEKDEMAGHSLRRMRWQAIHCEGRDGRSFIVKDEMAGHSL